MATPDDDTDRPRTRVPGSVQSVHRTFDLLQILADAGGALGLSQLAKAAGLPQTTIHRLLSTLIQDGYVRHEASQRYLLGPRLIQLGNAASAMLGVSAREVLTDLVTLTGETANLAVLEGGAVVYLSQVPGRHSMRMFTEPGRRVDAHCTAVGKAMLAQLPDDDVREVMRTHGMTARTPTTITDVDTLIAHLEIVRAQGYAIDEGEQEVGVRCIAVAVPESSPRAAVSISGPETRISNDKIDVMVPGLAKAAATLADEMGPRGAFSATRHGTGDGETHGS